MQGMVAHAYNPTDEEQHKQVPGAIVASQSSKFCEPQVPKRERPVSQK